MHTKTRAPRIAPPGIQRITLTGIMAVPDDFGRLRLLLIDEQPNGVSDSSWGRLRNAVPCLHSGYNPPYKISNESLGPYSDGVRGTAWFVPPAHRRAHWLEVAAALRGQWVTVEATVRPFSYPSSSRNVLSENVAHQRGASLDIAMITPMIAPMISPRMI